MTKVTTKPDSLQSATELAVDLFDNWIDPIETEVRARARGFIEELIRGELDAALARPRYGRSQTASNEAKAGVTGHRHGSRPRSLTTDTILRTREVAQPGSAPALGAGGRGFESRLPDHI